MDLIARALRTLVDEMIKCSRQSARRAERDGTAGSLKRYVFSFDMMAKHREEQRTEDIARDPVRAGCALAVRELGERVAVPPRGRDWGRHFEILDAHWNGVGGWWS